MPIGDRQVRDVQLKDADLLPPFAMTELSPWKGQRLVRRPRSVKAAAAAAVSRQSIRPLLAASIHLFSEAVSRLSVLVHDQQHPSDAQCSGNQLIELSQPTRGRTHIYPPRTCRQKQTYVYVATLAAESGMQRALRHAVTDRTHTPRDVTDSFSGTSSTAE